MKSRYSRQDSLDNAVLLLCIQLAKDHPNENAFSLRYVGKRAQELVKELFPDIHEKYGKVTVKSIIDQGKNKGYWIIKDKVVIVTTPDDPLFEEDKDTPPLDYETQLRQLFRKP